MSVNGVEGFLIHFYLETSANLESNSLGAQGFMFAAAGMILVNP